MDRLSDLRVFVRLSETLSFTETAVAVGLSRASVGRMVERLEADLGTRLVQRTTRRVGLTPDGTAFLGRASALIAEADSMAAMFAAPPRPRGLLRVNVPTRMGRRLFAPRLPEFLERHPDIELDLAATDRPVDLVGEGFDCVVRVGEQRASGLVSRTLGGYSMLITNLPVPRPSPPAWNRGRIVGQKRALLPRHVWAIRVRLELAGRVRDLALFNMAIDSKLRGCDLVRLQVADIFAAGRVKERASIVQSKTQRPVRFEITETTREAVHAWIASPAMIGSAHLWPSRFHDSPHISTRQYGRMLKGWVAAIGLEPSAYGTHSMRRTKAAQIYKKTGNLRAVQLLLGHTKMDSTVRYLGVELEDALEISEGIDL